jgi:quercetin dioxygenase-like cupin family protein
VVTRLGNGALLATSRRFDSYSYLQIAAYFLVTAMFFLNSDALAVEMLPGLIRKTLVSGDKLMICRFDLDRGVAIPTHSHPHDQAGYVVAGKIRVTVNGKSCDLGPGDSYSAPSKAPHSALAIEASVVVDAFSPPRED